MSAEGIPVYAPDIRGHGQTGVRGDIDYAGQLDDDMADFIRDVVDHKEERHHIGEPGFIPASRTMVHIGG